MKLRPVIALLAISIASPAFADYFAIGKVEGTDCYGFGISTCKNFVIYAVERDGQMYHVARRYEEVSDYRDGRCWIQVESRGGGLLSGALNLFLPNQFYTRNEAGEYEAVEPESLTFRCVKR